MALNRRVSTQDITWFLDLNQHRQLDLDPPYQRRSVWTAKDRRFFMDTVFRGYPCPPVFLHKWMDGATARYSVVDGKQRLETILLFADNKLAMGKDYSDTRLNGMKWNAIKQDPDLARSFWDYVFTVEFTDMTDSTLVNEVFDRLNRNSMKLTEQELRHARFSGWFISLVEDEAETDEWKALKVVTSGRKRRMQDVQFLSELLMVSLSGKIAGFDQSDITRAHAEYDDPADPELEFEFDDQYETQKFWATRAKLLEIERHGRPVSVFASDKVNFYTLWALVALNGTRIEDTGEFTKLYAEFMTTVDSYRKNKELAEATTDDMKLFRGQALIYFQNSIGASTEMPQRDARYRALLNGIFGENPDDENTKND